MAALILSGTLWIALTARVCSSIETCSLSSASDGPAVSKASASVQKLLASALAGSKSRLSCFLECSLDRLYGLGIAGLDEGDPDIAGAFHPPCGPCWRLDQPRLVKRMVEEDLLRQLIQVRLMIGVETGIAALVLVEAIHLR